jgi:hypothetical protein
MFPKSIKRPTAEYYLSVRQPYAWAIVSGIKDVENRSWLTNIRGRIFIHAGKNKDGVDDGMDDPRGKGVRKLPKEQDLVFGAIIGSVEIVDCVEKHGSKWFAKGNFGLLLEKPRTLKVPVSMKANAKMQRVPERVLKNDRMSMPWGNSRIEWPSMGTLRNPPIRNPSGTCSEEPSAG